MEPLPQHEIDGPDSPTSGETYDHDLRAELESLHRSHHTLLSKSAAMEETLNLLHRERDDAVSRNADLTRAVGEVSSQNDSFGDRIQRLEEEAEAYRERIQELEIAREKASEFLSKSMELLRSAKESLSRIIDDVIDEGDDVIDEKFADAEFGNGLKETDSKGVESEFREELTVVTKLAIEAEEKVNSYQKLRKKEKRELENSVVSLTEENRDINSLLRVALMEKDAVEKRLKGNTEQKRVAILQIAERGLQRVGFGFMMGGGNTEPPPLSSESSGTRFEAPAASSGTKSDSSECEEEVVNLTSTVERIMKNLRLEITQLRRSLEESRSDTERLQSLTEKQAQNIAENTLYIKELEYRERVLTRNVEELVMEIKETEAEVARWREACEMEVEAGKVEIQERDKVLFILKQELEKTKAALDISNGKLKLKEELAAAAMAAQAAAEKSLQLADSRSAGLRERIEELVKQLEEAESRERSNRRMRHICWPWRALKANAANNLNNSVQNVKRMIPEMQALLHYNV